MAGVKKSIYLDPELDAALKASAERDGRSVTKQIDVLLRNALAEQQRNWRVTQAHPSFVVTGQAISMGSFDRPARPDPKPSSKKKRP